MIAAPAVSGLPATPFTFLGYAPRGSRRVVALDDQWRSSGQTVVFFDAPGRIARTISRSPKSMRRLSWWFAGS